MYRPRRMVPPRSPAPSTNCFCSSMVAMTGTEVSGSNSVEDASRRPSTLRAYSMTMDCRPRQMPRVGILCSRAYLRAPILPSRPRMPKPPGTRIASILRSWWSASSSVAHRSAATHLMLTFTLFAKPPARRASETDRYASGRSMYLPTRPTLTSAAGRCTASSRRSHWVKSGAGASMPK